jgi:hypothetical protein
MRSRRGKVDDGNEDAAACLRALKASHERLDLGPSNGLVLPVALCLNMGAIEAELMLTDEAVQALVSRPRQVLCNSGGTAMPMAVSIWRTRCSRMAGSRPRTRSTTSTAPERWLLQTQQIPSHDVVQ